MEIKKRFSLAVILGFGGLLIESSLIRTHFFSIYKHAQEQSWTNAESSRYEIDNNDSPNCEKALSISCENTKSDYTHYSASKWSQVNAVQRYQLTPQTTGIASTSHIGTIELTATADRNQQRTQRLKLNAVDAEKGKQM